MLRNHPKYSTDLLRSFRNGFFGGVRLGDVGDAGRPHFHVGERGVSEF